MPTDAATGPQLANGYTYEQAKADLAELEDINAQMQALQGRRGQIYQRMEQRGENRGVFKSMVALSKKSAAAIQADEDARQRLFAWLVQPKIDQAQEDDGA